MHFAHPAVLLLLGLLPLAALYQLTLGKKALARIRFSSLELLGKRPSSYPKEFMIPMLLRLTALALLIIALARPQAGQRREEVLAPATDIMLCLDTSTSMEALDFKPKNRLDAAKDVIREFIKARARDRIGLVVFSGLAFTQCPLTLDHGALLGFLENVTTGMMPEDGTAIGSGIATSTARLKDSQAKSKVLILLTDGRNNRGTIDPITAARAAQALGIKIYVVGCGALGGSVYPVKDPFGNTRYVTLPEELDEVSLKRIAETTKGLYFRAANMERLREIYQEIDQLEKTDIKVETYTDYRDLYFPLLLLALMSLAVEVGLTNTLWRRVP